MNCPICAHPRSFNAPVAALEGAWRKSRVRPHALRLLSMHCLLTAIGASLPIERAHAADNCATAPGGAAPKGQHWYYRVDQVNHRKCWYLHATVPLADHAAAESRAAPSESVSAAETTPSPSAETAQTTTAANGSGETAGTTSSASNRLSERAFCPLGWVLHHTR